MVTISTTSGAVTVTFADNGHYLQNGSISFPLNSLVLVTDSSDMATFRNVAEDIVFSATYTELGMSKDDLIDLYESSFVGDSGVSPEDVEEMIEEAVSGKQDTSGMTAYTLTSTTDSLSGTVTAHTANTAIHVSANDKTNWNAKVDRSDLDAYAMTDDVNEALEVASRALHELKETKQDASAMTDYASASALNSHVNNADIHVTANDKTNWDSKLSAVEAGTNISVTNSNRVNLNITQEINTGGQFAPSSDVAYMTACLFKVNNLMSNNIYAEKLGYSISGGAKKYLNLPWSSVTGTQTIATEEKLDSRMGGCSIVALTQAEYDALTTKNPTTLYIITE